MKKRVVSLLLTLILVLGLFPLSAFAFGESVLAGIPVTADPGSSATGWTEKDGMLQTLNQGKSYTTSTLTLTFTEDACISFQYKASTEENYDKLTIALNGSTKDTVSGDTGWKSMTVEAAAGDKLTFAYKKDGSGDKNEDTCYLKGFSLKESVLITFHANNGTEDTVTQKIYGQAALKANTFTKDHGLFVGWATSPEGEKVYGDGESIDKPESNLDLYALWASAWEVTFEGVKTILVADNTPAGEAPVPTKTGYEFGGWFNGDTAYDPTAPVTADATYTARWTPIAYTVKFDGNGGEGEVASMEATYDVEFTLPRSTFTKSGYKCLGWSTNKNAETAQYIQGATVKNLASNKGDIVTLYVVWAGSTVKVTIDLNYDVENRITTRDCVVGKNYNYVDVDGVATFQRLSDPTRDGYLFIGWFDAAEGGNEITTSYKFASADPVTLYAHWVEAVTITFDAGAGSCYTKSKTIEKGGTIAYLPTPSLSGKAFEGWFTAQEGGEKVDSTTIFNESLTLYAHYRGYQETITFKPNGGTGEMATFSVPLGETRNLPLNTFTREGYVFTYWSISTYDSNYNTQYADGAAYTPDTEDYWGDPYDRDTTATLYAHWQERSFEAVFRAIEAKLPENYIVKATGSLNLLTETDTGYTIAYTSSNSEYLSEDGNVLALPESGVLEVTLTATVTDTKDGSTQSRTYVLKLYSQEAIDTELALKEAAEVLITSNYQPKYGRDTSIIAMAEQRLKDKGYEGLTVTVQAAASDYYNYAGIEADGTIRYYYNPGMTGSSGYVHVQLIVHKGDVSALPSSTSYVLVPWDEGKALATLTEKANNVTLPTEVTAEDTLYLPQHPYKEGVTGETASGYSDYYTWASIKWTSSEETSILIGYPYYSPYAVTISQKAQDVEVTLTAVFTLNNVSNVSLTRTYTVVVKSDGTDPSEILRQELQSKLDAAMADPGVRDFVTNEKADYANVTGDLRFPNTREIGIDGSETPINLSSSDPTVAVTSDTNNSTRVYIYQPLPGEASKDVDLTITITDKATGVQASATITVTVQPLTSEEIDAELALMAQVKAHYFDGIKGENTDPNAITENLHAFQEVYSKNGQLIWVYNYSDRTDTGIIPDDIDGWYESQNWRAFRSSNPAVIHHENLLVERQKEHTTVTITSWLSSQKYGKYAERYPNDSRFTALYKQPVTATLKVLGTDPTPGVEEPDEKTISVTFRLRDNGTTWLSRSLTDLPAGTTALEAAKKALSGSGYSLIGGSYISGVRQPSGNVLSEKDRGENSGWMYSVNGYLPGVYMSSYVMKDGDTLVLFYTDDYTNGGDQSGEDTTEDGADTEGIDIYKITGDYLEALGEEVLSQYGAEWKVIGLARSGRTVPEGYYAAVEAYVQENILEGDKLDKNRITENARVILALTAIGEDPTNVAGHNLLLPLGDVDFVQKQGINGIVYTLLALDAGAYEIPAVEGKEALTREQLIALLLEKQLEDGGWAFSGTAADADMTAMVLQALAPYRETDAVQEAIDKALTCLSNLQQDSGAFASMGQENCESTAQVVIALCVLDIDPTADSRFVKSNGNAYEALCRFYVEGGGFAHTLTTPVERNDLATQQGYLALTAYHRYLDRQAVTDPTADLPTHLWDMTDAK